MADEQGFDPTQYGATAVEDTPQPFDPTAHGAVPVEEERSIPSKIGHAVLDTVKGFLPQSVEQAALAPITSVPGIGKVGTLLSNIAFGKPIAEGLDPLAGIPVVQQIPRIAAAEKTAPYSQERFTAGIGTLADVAMLAGFKGLAEAPKLAEVVKGKAEPATPMEAAVEPIVTPPNEPTGVAQPQIEPAAAQPVPAATEATTEVLGKREPVAGTTAAGTGEAGWVGPLYHGSPDFQGEQFSPEYRGRETGLSRGGFNFTESKPTAEEFARGKVDPDQASVDIANQAMRDAAKLMDNGVKIKGYTESAELPEFNVRHIDDSGDFRSGLNELADRMPPEIASKLREAAQAGTTTANPAVIEAYVKNPKKVMVQGKPTWIASNPEDISIAKIHRQGLSPVSEAPVSTTAKTSQEIPTGSGIQETGGATTAPLSTETPVPEGMTRVYRGGQKGREGNWFSTEKDVAEFHQDNAAFDAPARLSYVDIPTQDLVKYQDAAFEHPDVLSGKTIAENNDLVLPKELSDSATTLHEIPKHEPITTGEPNASQEPSTTSVTQPEVRTQVGEGTPLRQQGEAPETRQGTEAGTQTTQDVAPEIPEGAKATVKVKDTSGNTVDVPNVDAKEWADKFTKERDSYKALIDCLGR